MNITLNVEASSPEELKEALAGLVENTPASTEKTKPTRKTQSKKKTDPPKTEPTSTGEESNKEDIPTVVELRAKAQEKGETTEGKKAVKALLNEFGSKSISHVPEEKRAEFLARLEEL